jgi:DNA-binding XRE family transcriptional regulator
MATTRTIGRRIKRIRESEYWTCSRLAHRIGVSEDTLRNIERGGRMPRPDEKLKIARILGIKVGDLV